MPQLHVKSGSRAAQRIELLPGVIRLGRNATNDYSFEDATVSARHCEVTLEDGAVRVSDLGSTNGTFIDGQQVTQALLLPGQTLHLGSVAIVLENLPTHIAIPSLAGPQPNPLSGEGAPLCYHHSSSQATLECRDCGKTFCDLCIHQIRRVGGAVLKLCPVCGANCRVIEPFQPEKKRKSRIISWLGKVTARMK